MGVFLHFFQVYADPAKRLELYYRPKDPYCHPLCANRFPTTTMILRVKIKTRKKRSDGMETESQASEQRVTMEIIGVVGTVYKFQGTYCNFFTECFTSHFNTRIFYTFG